MSPPRPASYRAKKYIKNTLIILFFLFIKLYLIISKWKGRKINIYIRLTSKKMVKVVKK